MQQPISVQAAFPPRMLQLCLLRGDWLKLLPRAKLPRKSANSAIKKYKCNFKNKKYPLQKQHKSCNLGNNFSAFFLISKDVKPLC